MQLFPRKLRLCRCPDMARLQVSAILPSVQDAHKMFFFFTKRPTHDFSQPLNSWVRVMLACYIARSQHKSRLHPRGLTSVTIIVFTSWATPYQHAHYTTNSTLSARALLKYMLSDSF